MDLNVLRTFVAVCEYSGFSAAGERLGYTQSTVSSQIRQLEKELNVALFDRFYHRIVLTQEGSLVLRYARDVLTAQEKLMVALHHADEVTGDLHLAMSSSMCSRYFDDDFIGFRDLRRKRGAGAFCCGGRERSGESQDAFSCRDHRPAIRDDRKHELPQDTRQAARSTL